MKYMYKVIEVAEKTAVEVELAGNQLTPDTLQASKELALAKAETIKPDNVQRQAILVGACPSGKKQEDMG